MKEINTALKGIRLQVLGQDISRVKESPRWRRPRPSLGREEQGDVRFKIDVFHVYYHAGSFISKVVAPLSTLFIHRV